MFVNFKEARNNLKIGDFIVDINDKDYIGIGKGEILKFYTGFLMVKFDKKELPILVSDNLFCYYKLGKGGKRCYSMSEIRTMLENNFIHLNIELKEITL